MFLTKFKNEFNVRASGQGQGGCSTCGYGAEPLMTDYDFEQLLTDIDQWVEEEFKKVEKK